MSFIVAYLSNIFFLNQCTSIEIYVAEWYHSSFTEIQLTIFYCGYPITKIMCDWYQVIPNYFPFLIFARKIPSFILSPRSLTYLRKQTRLIGGRPVTLTTTSLASENSWLKPDVNPSGCRTKERMEDKLFCLARCTYNSQLSCNLRPAPPRGRGS